MKNEDFNRAKEILWDDEAGPRVTTDPGISEELKHAMELCGVKVLAVGKKPRSRNKFILFTIRVFKPVGDFDRKFLTEEDLRNWHLSKQRGLNTLMKAPDSAFGEVEIEETEEMIWWTQAFSLAHRIGAPIDHIGERILKLKGIISAREYGI